MNESLITITLGATIAILGAAGIITADEGTALSGYAYSAITGTLGLVECIRGIIKRRKIKRVVREAELCGTLLKK